VRKVDDVTALQYQALRGSGLLSLLHTEDRLTMSQSVEGRVPYLDHRLVEFCFSCPLEWRIHDMDKRLSREIASRYQLLPSKVYKRTDKQGFATPYSQMLCMENNKKMFRKVINDAVDARPSIFDRENLHYLLNEHSEKIDNANRIFRAVTILKWLHYYNLDIN
jgi:asparagine synthase (glutamine-hydrolysing)